MSAWIPAACERPGCGARIVWTTSPAGAKLCVDARSVTGHLYVLEASQSGTPAAIKLTANTPETPQQVYVSHWLTCKNPPRPGE